MVFWWPIRSGDLPESCHPSLVDYSLKMLNHNFYLSAIKKGMKLWLKVFNNFYNFCISSKKLWLFFSQLKGGVVINNGVESSIMSFLAGFNVIKLCIALSESLFNALTLNMILLDFTAHACIIVSQSKLSQGRNVMKITLTVWIRYWQRMNHTDHHSCKLFQRISQSIWDMVVQAYPRVTHTILTQY